MKVLILLLFYLENKVSALSEKPGKTSDIGNTSILPTHGSSVSVSLSTSSKIQTIGRALTNSFPESTMTNQPATKEDQVSVDSTRINSVTQIHTRPVTSMIISAISSSFKPHSSQQPTVTYQTSNKIFSNASTSLSSTSTNTQPYTESTYEISTEVSDNTSTTSIIPTSNTNFLSRYLRIPGMVNLYNTLTYMSISDVISCAAECDSNDEEDFSCFSFDICAGQKLCSLSPENITNPQLLTDSVGCDHYVRKEPKLKTYDIPSREILGKYRKYSGMFNPFSTLTYMSISDAVSCAAECDSNDEEDFRCYSFDICAGQKLCSLSSENITKSNLLIESADCDHYSRWYENSEVSTVKTIIKPTKQTGERDIGLLVGVSIGTLIAGILLTVISMCIYKRYRNTKDYEYELENLRKY